MDEIQLLTFDRFRDKAQALELQQLFTQNGIPSEVEDDSKVFDPNFAFGNNTTTYSLKLHPDDFNKAERLIESLVLGDLDDVGPDYYLYSFSDSELKDILAHKDQWSPFDFVLAQKLLRERGHEVSKEELHQIREQRLEELAAPEKGQTGWIVAGYIFAVLISVVGIIIGWHLKSYKKTLPNGESVFAFSQNDRKNGKVIFYLGIFFFALSAGYWFVREIVRP
ncbi:hypothetical protein [Flavobacterium silvaticum]|uniref:DUF2007 domain-containing protein n=1 Tax=Flavobacterium silvaticum TaxID=1852020 RepID=A0A972FNY9_9FLAO|nr:hypothetical protein [Flavobacterium silvaticum]NMH29193.1 hypothetical protein [Flavobacterium silvaticum]